MASPTSFPASGSRSKKPLGRMAGWLRQALWKKPKKMPASQEGPGSDALPGCSQDNDPPPSSQDDPPPRCPQDHPPSSGLSSAALAESPALPPAQEGATSRSSGGRWSRDYDVCVCHSEEDLAAAQELVAYLEDCSTSLRCFLQLRDAAPGGAIVSELCRALDSSHCQVLLITPGFQRDPWCRYQMLQALSQAPGAEGRTIPLLSGLARDAYPPELRFMYFVDGRGPERGFRQVKEAILRCKLRMEGTGKGSADAQVTLLLSQWDPEGRHEAGNQVREPRALDPAGVTGPEELVALSMWSGISLPSRLPLWLGTPQEGSGEAGDSPRKVTKKLGTPQEGPGAARN